MNPTAAKCCPFSRLDPDLILPVDDLAVAHKEGGFPVSLGETEIIPLFTLATLFDTAEADTTALIREQDYPKSIVDKHRHTRMATIASSAMVNPTANPVRRYSQIWCMPNLKHRFSSGEFLLFRRIVWRLHSVLEWNTIQQRFNLVDATDLAP